MPDEILEVVETQSLESPKSPEDSFLSGLDESGFEDSESEAEGNEEESQESEDESEDESEKKPEDKTLEEKSPEEKEKETVEKQETVEAPEVASLRTELVGEKTRSKVYEELLRDTGHNYTLQPQLERFCRATGQKPQEFLSKLNEYSDKMGAPAASSFAPDTKTVLMKKATCDWREFMQNHPDIKDPEKELGDAAWNEIK
ncbi:MAG: hypothetical protein RRY40_00160, partial [Oscillospiraceae bacterium]